MNGQLRAESEEGRGSKFTFAFRFPVPTPAQESAFIEAAKNVPQPDNNVMTYSVPPPFQRSMQTRRHSNDSIRSRGSAGSGNTGRSEIDQLVEMIASPSLEDAPRSSNRSIKRRSSPASERGEFNVQDSGVPIRSIKIDEDDVDVPSVGHIAPSNLAPPLSPWRSILRPAVTFMPKPLHVLVAEDDPVNQAILTKRLAMDGYEVLLTKDGVEVVETFGSHWQECDIILMDLQVSQSGSSF